MTASLFLPSHVQMEWQEAMDNLLVAKEMHDHGYPLPGNWKFCENGILFYRAVAFLFGSSDFDELNECTYEIRFPERFEWLSLRDKHPEMEGEEAWIIEPVRALDTHYSFSSVETSFTDDGFKIESDGYGTDSFHFVKGFVEFKERFFYKLTIWRERDATSSADEQTGRNIDSVA
ncbi:hypothetical protein PV433_10755 [Paenibacillus sp. GYB004]|uniref:hypothetical protein n=1 Tax=Paenibacillus sp. GYB004 TaxID=2994393 RepID=UPI002F9682CA